MFLGVALLLLLPLLLRGAEYSLKVSMSPRCIADDPPTSRAFPCLILLVLVPVLRAL